DEHSLCRHPEERSDKGSALYGGLASSLNLPETYRMIDEQEFRRRCDASLEALKRALYDAEDDGGFEVEERGGALHLNFEEPPATFVISPNSAVRQIWISALSTSFKLDWDEAKSEFVLLKTGEALKPLLARLIGEQSGNTVKL
ncbi:MAG TPA: iron donor protein CyaY, partial [Terriglobales bacterium]